MAFPEPPITPRPRRLPTRGSTRPIHHLPITSDILQSKPRCLRLRNRTGSKEPPRTLLSRAFRRCPTQHRNLRILSTRHHNIAIRNRRRNTTPSNQRRNITQLLRHHNMPTPNAHRNTPTRSKPKTTFLLNSRRANPSEAKVGRLYSPGIWPDSPMATQTQTPIILPLPWPFRWICRITDARR